MLTGRAGVREIQRYGKEGDGQEDNASQAQGLDQRGRVLAQDALSAENSGGADRSSAEALGWRDSTEGSVSRTTDRTPPLMIHAGARRRSSFGINVGARLLYM